MSWCFYFQIKRALATRKKLIYVEVRDRTAKISRVVSKRNLDLVIHSTKKRDNSELFDRYWYDKRQTLTEEIAFEGWVLDSFGQVQAEISESSQFNSDKFQSETARPRGFSISSASLPSLKGKKKKDRSKPLHDQVLETSLKDEGSPEDVPSVLAERVHE